MKTNAKVVALLYILGFFCGCGEVQVPSQDLSPNAMEVKSELQELDVGLTNLSSMVNKDLSIRRKLETVVNEGERALLLNEYLSALSTIDLLGPIGEHGPVEVQCRLLAMREAVGAFRETILCCGGNELRCLDFDLTMVQHVYDESRRLEGLLQKLVEVRASPFVDKSFGYVNFPKSVIFLKDLGNFWSRQYLDAPRFVYETCFKGVSRAEKKRYFEKIKSVTGHYPQDVVKNGKLDL